MSDKTRNQKAAEPAVKLQKTERREIKFVNTMCSVSDQAARQPVRVTLKKEE